jgi:hypothetical protein
MQVYASVVATMDEPIFATQSLESVLYKAGRIKAPMLKSRVPVYRVLLYGFASISYSVSSSVVV